MLIIPILMALSFGLIVSLIGFFALNYVKKEGLGKPFKYTSYLTIIVGKLIFIGGIVCAVMMSCCSDSCGHGSVDYRTEISTECSKGDKSCSKKSECKKPCETKCTKTTKCTKDGNKEIVIEKEVIIEE